MDKVDPCELTLIHGETGYRFVAFCVVIRGSELYPMVARGWKRKHPQKRRPLTSNRRRLMPRYGPPQVVDETTAKRGILRTPF